MTIIHSHADLYSLNPIGSPPQPRSDAKPITKTAEVTVHLSGGAVDSIPTTYSKPPKPASSANNSKLFDDVRELSPEGTHPKALQASRTFLDIAHFDNGMQIIDVFA